MRYVVASFIFTWPLYGCAPYVKPASFYAELYTYTVRVSNLHTQSMGSGVWIGKYEILTAGHVVMSQIPGVCAPLYIEGPGFQCTAIVQRLDLASDLAILLADIRAPARVRVSERNPVVGQYCAMLGYALGLHKPTIEEGIIQEIDTDDDIRWNAVTHGGNSGGGVFVRGASGWELVSICRSRRAINGQPVETCGYGVSTQALRKFLNL